MFSFRDDANNHQKTGLREFRGLVEWQIWTSMGKLQGEKEAPVVEIVDVLGGYNMVCKNKKKINLKNI